MSLPGITAFDSIAARHKPPSRPVLRTDIESAGATEGSARRRRQAHRMMETSHSPQTASTSLRFRTGFKVFGGGRPEASPCRGSDRRPPSSAWRSRPRAAQPPHLGRRRPIVLPLPIEIRRLAYPSFPADIRHRHSVSSLLQNERLLSVRKSRCFRSSQPGNRRGKL